MSDVIDARPTGPAVPLPPPRPAPRRTRRTPAAVRVLWKVFAGVLVLGVLVWGPYSVITVLAHDERVEEQTFPAAGLTGLEISGGSGSIDVEAADVQTVEVRAEISDGLRPTGESREVVGATLRLHSSCPNYGSDFCWVNYEIRVPRDLELDIRSEDGSVTVSGSNALMTIDGDNGSIRLRDVGGPIQVSTDNGSVAATELRSHQVTADADNGRVRLEFVEAPTTVVATSNNGRVEVVVPDDGTAYRVDAHSDNGGENVEVPTDPASTHTITVRTDNGSVTARTS